ncbi:MAG: molybdopterin-binding protein, partial [Dehalococcoidales bacterium]|nr:molybdopterin-binding protein [Dehalococcoidales bacterium]
AVLTFSDSRTEEDDESGRLLRQKLEEAGHKVTDYGVLKDDAAVISRKISGQLDVEELDIEV